VLCICFALHCVRHQIAKHTPQFSVSKRCSHGRKGLRFSFNSVSIPNLCIDKYPKPNTKRPYRRICCTVAWHSGRHTNGHFHLQRSAPRSYAVRLQQPPNIYFAPPVCCVLQSLLCLFYQVCASILSRVTGFPGFVDYPAYQLSKCLQTHFSVTCSLTCLHDLSALNAFATLTSQAQSSSTRKCKSEVWP
jgi:hypothetical protein